MKKYEFLEHTADIKFIAYGKKLNEVFENSAIATIKSMYEGKVKTTKKVKIKVKGKDYENLMYNFLEEILFLFDSEHLILNGVKVKIDEKALKLKAEIKGDNAKNYNIDTHIKAVTYNDMLIKREKNSWTAQVVLDV